MDFSKERIREEVETALREGGYRLLDLRVGANRRLGVTLDDEPALPITVDDCVRVTRLLVEHLTRRGIEPGDYHIEVLSPGADRLLLSDEHLERFRGQRVTVRTRTREASGRARYTGTLLASEEPTRLRVEIDGRERRFARDEITEVRLRP